MRACSEKNNNLLQAEEKATYECSICICFCFASDWLREWYELF